MVKTPRRLVGITEIAEHLGIRRQRAEQITGYKSFPAPVANLRMGRVWAYDNVRAWAETRGRVWYEQPPTYRPKRVRGLRAMREHDVG